MTHTYTFIEVSIADVFCGEQIFEQNLQCVNLAINYFHAITEELNI